MTSYKQILNLSTRLYYLFILRKLQEEYLNKKKKLYMCFVDLEKAFDGVPRKVNEWAMRKKGL